MYCGESGVTAIILTSAYVDVCFVIRRTLDKFCVLFHLSNCARKGDKFTSFLLCTDIRVKSQFSFKCAIYVW